MAVPLRFLPVLRAVRAMLADLRRFGAALAAGMIDGSRWVCVALERRLPGAASP
jgi:hypothetical protein